MARWSRIAAIALLTLGSMLPAAMHAAEPDFLGIWTVASSEPAPWADAHEKPVVSDIKALTGRPVAFLRDKIDGPSPLACRKPNYRIKPYSPDMLFQGSLDKPEAQAPALGFKEKTIKTLETGCAGAIDFHFQDSDNALFALNNRIYKIQRKKP